jgi:hypothetical protein
MAEPTQVFIGFRSLSTLEAPAPLYLRLSRLFLAFPQGTFVVHRIRTAYPTFFVAEISVMRESAVTAGVDVTLPVIAQGWFCGSLRG